MSRPAEPMHGPVVARRRLLLATGGVGVSFLAGCSLPVIPQRPKPELADALGWVRYAEGRYTLLLPRVEMGQAIGTALKQIACQELGVAWDRVVLRLHGTADIARVRASVGSESVKDFALPLAQACATLRDALAAGRVSGELKAEPRAPAQLRAFQRGGSHVGRTPPLEQGRAVVTGQPLFVADVRRTGMLFGRVLRTPASPELVSRPSHWDAAAARAVPGFVAIVQDAPLTLGRSEGLGLVARTPAALDRIEQALAVQWQVQGRFEQGDIDAAIDIDRRRGSARRRDHSLHDDPVATEAPWSVDLRVDVPLAAHATIEPRAAVAEFAADGSLRLWVGSQDVFYQRDVVARRLALDAQQVVVQGLRVGGAFGGKTICTVELEAAVLARAAAAPVKVQWSRAQEFRFGFHRPPSSHRLRARLVAGRLGDWQHHFASSHILFTNAVLPPWLQHITDLVGDDGVARGARLPYRTTRQDIGFDLARLPVFTGPWRGLGAGPNGLAIESAIDECAVVAGADPVRFRLDHAEDPRLARCLERATIAAGWRGAAAERAGGLLTARGVACGIYKGMSYAAVVADVVVDLARREIRVSGLLCAHDCGFVINPDQVRAQCEGNLVWGLGMALFERLGVAGAQVAATTFADSPMPRMGDVPPMQIVLVDEGDTPGGAGETAIVAAAAAIANAVRAATGVRAGRFPMTLESLGL